MKAAAFSDLQQRWEGYAALVVGRKPEEAEDYLLSRLEKLPEEWGYVPIGSFLPLDKELQRGKVLGRDGLELMSQRIVFPVRDENGLLRGFVARLVSIDEDPRTRYTRVTIPHWRWGGLLYGWHSIQSYHSSLVLVEGTLDAEALHRKDLPSLAYITSTVSKRQALHIRRYFRSVVLVPDNEEQARKLVYKSRLNMEAVKLQVNVLYTPGAKDTAEWVNNGCPGKMLKKLKGLVR